MLGVKIKTPFRFAVALSVKAKQKQSWDALCTENAKRGRFAYSQEEMQSEDALPTSLALHY